MTDIFQFWAKVQPTDYVHPADRDVLSRTNHHFDLKCLPGCFAGPLRTAPVVLLYLSPGRSEKDRKEAKSKSVQDHWMRCRRGRDPFPKDPSFTKCPGYAVWYKWVTSRTKCFGDWDRLHSKIAVLDIGAYHSKTFVDYPLLAALPSSRVSIAWAQGVLFPQAIAGRRVVICLRAARFWGLEAGKKYGRFLFAPPVNQGGHMKHGKMREQIIEAVKSVINQPRTK
jgi:hypothetical protein